MSMPERPAPQRMRALIALAVGVLLSTLPLFALHAWLLIGPWLAQPAFALAVAWWFGSRPAGEATARWLPDAFALALLWALAWLLATLIVAWPLQSLLRTGSLAAALALSAAIGLCLIGLWRAWPMFVQAERRGGGLSAWQSAAEDAVAVATVRGLCIAIAIGVLLALVLSIAWPGLPLTHAGRVGLTIAALLLAPIVHALIHRLGTLLPARASADIEVGEPVAAEVAPYVLPFDDTRDPNEVAYTAARWGRVDTALAALAHGADPHCLPEADERDQRSLPVLAAVLNELSLLRELIARGVDLNRVHAGLTPLLAATRDSWHGRIEAVTMLLANGADARVADADGDTPLHHAARSSDAGVAALLLDAGALIDACNNDGFSPLGVACASGNWRLARFLLEHGARCEPDGGQPALLAAAGGEDEIAGVQLLLKHKAKVDARGVGQRTALMQACETGNPEIAGVLLDARADINARDALGMSALMHAAIAGSESVLPRLAKARPDALAVDNEGRNALAIACASERAEPGLIRALLGMGVNPQQVSADGRCPMDHALAAGRWRLVAELDPAHPLPDSVAEDLAAGPHERSAQDVLRDALAARRFDRADALLKLPDSDAAAAVTALLPQFALDADIDVFDWLLAHGADAEHRDGFADSVLFTLLDRGGVSAMALMRLLERAWSPAGSGGLACYLAGCARCETSTRGQEQLALALLERGADPFAGASIEAGDDAPLALAIRLGWLRLAKKLLALGVSPDGRDARGLTPLHLATSLGREAAVRLLIRFGAHPGLRTPNGETALGMAFAADRADLAAWLDWRGWRLPRRALQPGDLPAAAMLGDADAVLRLLELGLPIDTVDAQGCSALLRAAGGGHLAVIDVLLHRGANTALAADTGATALSAAVSMRHPQIVEHLLDHGADVNQALAGGVTPLMLAAALGLPEMVSRLLAHHADLEHTDDYGIGALHCACIYAFQARERQRVMALLDTLLLSGAEPDAASYVGETPLLLLLGARAEPGTPCDEGIVLEAMEYLLNEDARLDARDARGYTPMHLAAMHGLAQVVQRLLRAGAEPRPRDALNRTPHDLALQRGYIDVAAEFEPVRSLATPSLARFLRKE